MVSKPADYDEAMVLSSSLGPAGLIERAVRDLLEAVGEDPNRDGLKGTPARVAAMYLGEICTGYNVDIPSLFTQFEKDGYNEMIVVRDIPIYSLCEHHLLPFIGRAQVGYVPNKKIIGLSKIARLCDAFARRLQVQERLTIQIARTLEEQLNAMGVVVVITAEHLCMTMRGVQKPGSVTTTSAIRGLFRDGVAARQEFFSLIGGGR